MAGKNQGAKASAEEDGVDFAAFLATVRPKTVAEASEAMRDLVGKVRDTGKKGTLTLTITVAPFEADSSVLTINDEIKVRAPEHTRKPALAWPDDRNNLSRSDPSQMPLWEDVRTAEPFNPESGEIKEPPTA